MKRFCIDTSAITNPLQTLPEDVHPTLWNKISGLIESGILAVTTEIYSELYGSVSGEIGACIDSNQSKLVLEISTGDWPDHLYVQEVRRLQVTYELFISEYIDGNPTKTICMNDISIVALASALRLPLISMESSSTTSQKYKRIPDICELENIEHFDFNEFLRHAGIVI